MKLRYKEAHLINTLMVFTLVDFRAKSLGCEAMQLPDRSVPNTKAKHPLASSHIINASSFGKLVLGGRGEEMSPRETKTSIEETNNAEERRSKTVQTANTISPRNERLSIGIIVSEEVHKDGSVSENEKGGVTGFNTGVAINNSSQGGLNNNVSLVILNGSEIKTKVATQSVKEISNSNSIDNETLNWISVDWTKFEDELVIYNYFFMNICILNVY